MINDALMYSGKVTVQVKNMKTKKIVSERVIKNAGTINLFEFLCNCLLGQYESSKKPNYLDASAQAYNLTTNQNTSGFQSDLFYRSILNDSNKAKITEQVILDDGTLASVFNWHVKFSAALLRNQLNDEARTNGITSLALFTNPNLVDNNEAMLAWVNLINEAGAIEPIQISENQTILVEWDLSFNNYVKNSI